MVALAEACVVSGILLLGNKLPGPWRVGTPRNAYTIYPTTRADHASRVTRPGARCSMLEMHVLAAPARTPLTSFLAAHGTSRYPIIISTGLVGLTHTCRARVSTVSPDTCPIDRVLRST